MSYPLAVQIILIPLIWLAAMTLVVAACQVAARADGCRPSPTPGEAEPEERAVLDQHQGADHFAPAFGPSGTGRQRSAMLHNGR
jgi:hypothetical protein